jgi:hypothetical protein
MIKSKAVRIGCSAVVSAICFSFIAGTTACHASTPHTGASISKSSPPAETKTGKSNKAKKLTPGWSVTTASDKFGLARYYFSDSTLKVESAMLVILVDARTKFVTFGAWESKKYFEFPLDKSAYYTKLMGISPGHISSFAREFKLSPWKQTRTLKIGDMDATEYERHVLNPPPGRTRTQIRIMGRLGNLASLSPKVLSFYHQLHDEMDFPSSDGILVEDRTIITNPSQGWADCTAKSAVKTMLTPEQTSFPPGFQKVNSQSELFMDDGAEGKMTKFKKMVKEQQGK